MSAEGLNVDLRDGVLILTIANPPMNDLGPQLRAALAEAITGRSADVRGVVLAAAGPNSAAFLPLDPDDASPSLAVLCRAVADCTVPVVAVLQGLVTGPGAELALAARARLAAPTLRFSFADVTLGLCPAGGTTQRLPRLLGAEQALRLLLSGHTVSAAEALGMGLIDGITETAPVAAAARLAKALSVGELLRRAAPDGPAWQQAITDARQDPMAQSRAGRRIVDCVEAALLLPAENAQSFETIALSDLQQTPESLGLRAAARAERLALRVPPVLAHLRPLSVDRIGLLGVAPDLARLAAAALSRDLGVDWVFANAEARHAGLQSVRAVIGEGTRAGTLTRGRAQMMLERLNGSEDPVALASVPLLVTDHLLGNGDGWGGVPGAAQLLLGGSETEMGLALGASGRVCEVTLPPESLPLARVTALTGLRRIGLTPMLVARRPVVGARMEDAGRTALAWMVSRGVPRRQIAAALESFGVALPDHVSIDAPKIQRAMPLAEVLNRWLAALANEGARLLDQGVARRPSDIDHLMVAGYQFPRWQGGPMHQADRRGLMVLRHDLRAWGAEAALWSPAPLINRLLRDGKTFASLND